MKLTCNDFERLADPHGAAGEEERALWARHVEACARCSEQLAADRLLRRSLGPPPARECSAGFDASLRQKLSMRRQPRPLSRKARFAFRAYAMLASALSLWILARIQWPAGFAPVVGAVLLALFGLAPAMMLLPRRSPLAPPELS